MDLQLIRRAERATLALGAIAVLASLVTRDLRLISGVAVGATVGWLNLVVVRSLVVRYLRATAPKGAVVGLFFVKFALLAGLVAVCVLVLGVSGTGFLIGFFALVVAVTVIPLIYGIQGGHSQQERQEEES